MAESPSSSSSKQTPKVVYKQKIKTAGPAAQSGSTNRSRSLGTSKLLLSGLALGFIVLFFAVLDQFKERFYIFSPERLRELQLQVLKRHGNDTRAVIDDIVSTLRAEHPAWALSDKEEWIFNNAGGAMGGMYIIHASLTEYLIIFGTPIGTEGHTGRHTADDYFHILSGEQTAYTAGALEKEVYPVGSVHHLRRGTVKQYKFHEGGFALEYAVGLIPPMFGFGFADGFSSTLDVGTLWDTTRVTGREMIRNMLHGKL